MLSKRLYSLIEVSIDFEELLEPDRVQDLIYIRRRAEQLDIFLEAAFTLTVDLLVCSPAIFRVSFFATEHFRNDMQGS